MSGRKGRVRAERRFALQALYQFDSGLAGELDAVRDALESAAEIDEFGESPDTSSAEVRMAVRDPDAAIDRAKNIEDGLGFAALVWEHRNEADAAMKPYTAEWPVHRQPVIDRNALRLGWYAFTHGGDPIAVAIDETVELVKTFSTEKSGAFVNAVLRSLLLGRTLSEELIDEIESRLIAADVGVKAARELVEGLRKEFRSGTLSRGEDALEYLKKSLKSRWPAEARAIVVAERKPTVVLVVGVNGVGKTTSVAKIARSLKDEGRTVLLAAADTFRAGAVAQLTVWSERLGIEIVKGKAGADPAAVAFDAADAAIARGVDVLLVDTAGRLHTQDNLMRELSKIRNVLAKKIPGAPHEVLLVLDATSGQNAVQQARLFGAAAGVTGIFLAKLDGTARGGIVVAIREELDVPVKLIGGGERPEDVQPVDPDRFVEAMFAG